MRIPVGLLILTLATVLENPVLAQRLEIIELQHRPAEEMIPLLRPFLEEGGTLSGQRGQLFVRTSPQNLAQLKQLLASIDTVVQQLVVTVLQGEATKLVNNEIELNARFGVRGSGQVTLGSPGSSADSAKLRVRSTRSRQRGEDVQRVRVMEGGAATIFIGQAIPIAGRSVTRDATGIATTDTIEYRTIVSGYSIVPRLIGDRVTLTVSAQREAPSSSGGGRIDVQGLETTVTGDVGEWIVLGGVTRVDKNKRKGVIYRNTETLENKGRVLVKVDRAP